MSVKFLPFCLLCGLMLPTQKLSATDFANCSLANKQLKLLNDYMEPQLRVRAAQSLIKDIELLRPHIDKNTTGMPDRLLRLCFDIKKESFVATFVKGGSAMFGSYDFLMAAGRFFFIEKMWKSSHEAYEAAAKLRPNLFDPNYEALQAWIFLQLTIDKPLPAEVYHRKFTAYVEAMLKSSDIREDEKTVVLGYLAQAQEKNSKIFTARKMLERAIQLNPNDLQARFNHGELLIRSGDFNAAKSSFEEAIALEAPSNPVLKKEIYKRLLKLYSLQGEKKKRQELLSKAKAEYPQEKF